MGTLKSTLKIESTDLFPTPVSFTVVNNNSVNGDFSGFNTIEVSAATGGGTGANKLDATGGSKLNITNITSSAYIYAQAPTTNTANVHLCMVDGSTAGPGYATVSETFAILAPGDVIFMPYRSIQTEDVVLEGSDIYAILPEDTITTNMINYFIGEKS